MNEDLFRKLNKVKDTKEAIRVAIPAPDTPGVDVPFREYSNYIKNIAIINAEYPVNSEVSIDRNSKVIIPANNYTLSGDYYFYYDFMDLSNANISGKANSILLNVGEVVGSEKLASKNYDIFSDKNININLVTDHGNKVIIREGATCTLNGEVYTSLVLDMPFKPSSNRRTVLNFNVTASNMDSLLILGNIGNAKNLDFTSFAGGMVDGSITSPRDWKDQTLDLTGLYFLKIPGHTGGMTSIDGGIREVRFPYQYGCNCNHIFLNAPNLSQESYDNFLKNLDYAYDEHYCKVHILKSAPFNNHAWMKGWHFEMDI